MEFLKGILRERTAGILFIIGITISCFVLINIAELVNKINKENNYLNRYNYEVSFRVDRFENFEGVKAFDTIEKLLQNIENGNFVIEQSVSINGKSITANADIIIKQNETLQLDYQTEYVKDGSNNVIIGESLLKHTSIIDGKRRIKIYDNDMYVVGVLENNMSGGVDNSLYILWDSCDDIVRESLKKHTQHIGLSCKYLSQGDISQSYNEINKQLEEEGYFSYIMSAEELQEYQSYWYRAYNTIFLSIGLLFSVTNCFTVSYLWINGRRNEIAIKKAYGYSMGRLVADIYVDILKMSLVGFILTIVVKLIQSLVIENSFEGVLWILKAAFVCIGMIIVAFITTLYLINYVKKVTPATIIYGGVK